MKECKDATPELASAVEIVGNAVIICEQNLPSTDIQRITLHSQIGYQIQILEDLMRRLENINEASSAASTSSFNPNR